MKREAGSCEVCMEGGPAVTKRRIPVAADWYGERVEWRLFDACAACADRGVADGEQPGAKTKKGGTL